MSSPQPPILVVGAGVAGLTCACELVRGGRSVVVLEKSRGVGGRCATRRVAGFPVDHGVTFYHGDDAAFLHELERAGAASVAAGWPRSVVGGGAPCQPDAFDPRQRRLALRDGATAFPKRLAAGLDVRRSTEVLGLRLDRAVEVDCGSARLTAPTLVLALAATQTLRLLEPLGNDSRELAAACELLREVAPVPCLTLLARYPESVEPPSWDMNYPGDSAILQLVSHESSKRGGSPGPVLVLQARPRWSRTMERVEVRDWTTHMLEEAARRLGRWAGAPALVESHRWAFARADPATHFAAPLLLDLGAGRRLGLCGEAFAPEGGVQAAWRSGRRLAARILEETEA